jgi:hypothetical protein
MSQQENIAIAQTFLEGVGSGRDPAEIAGPFAADLVFEIQGDDGCPGSAERPAGRRWPTSSGVCVSAENQVGCGGTIPT